MSYHATMAQGETLSSAALGEDIHVWVVNLRGSDKHVSRCASTVSERELARADRFRFEHLRRQFLLAHGCVRALLAQYLRIPGAKIQFDHQSYGKPYVASPTTDLRFNQSDSGELAAFAFAFGCELGIDIEALRPMPNMEDVAARFFSHQEVIDLFSLAPEFRTQAFYAAWTRKEAYIKAVGDGLQIPLDAFRVALLPHDEVRLIHIADDLGAAREWQLHTFDPTAGFLGALAYRGRRRKIRLFPPQDASDLLDGALNPTHTSLPTANREKTQPC